MKTNAADTRALDGGGTVEDRVEGLSLFYPMYNEEGNIEEAAARALRILPGLARSFEVILVDDGSRDQTGPIADRLAASDPRIRVVHHPRNLGYGAALRSGIRGAREPWIFYTDGDNQFDLGELPQFLALRDRFDLVIGYRRVRSDPFIRRLNAGVYNLAVGLLMGVWVRDVDCAFKLFRGSIFEGMELWSNGATIDLEILARARRRGARVHELPVSHYPRLHGRQTGANWRVILRAFRELFRLWTELGWARRGR